MKLPFLALSVAVLLATPALAADPVSLGTFGSWSAYSYDEGSGKVCFMSTEPEKQDSSVKGVKRDTPHVFITHWSGEKSKNVFSVEAGYPYKTDGKPTVAVNGKTFTLFAEGEKAWSKSDDEAIAVAVQKGSSLVVKGESKRGTKTTDTYSLKGSGDAYKAISKACGI